MQVKTLQNLSISVKHTIRRPVMGKVTSQRTSLSSKISRDPSMSFNVRDHRSLSKMSVEDDVSRQSYRLPSPTEVQSRSDVSCSLSSELRAISRQRSCKSFSIPSNAPFPSRIDSFKDLGDQFSGSSFSSLSSGSGSSCGSNLSLYERRKAFHVLHAKPGFTGIQPMAPVPSRLPSFEEVQWERNLQRGLGVRIPDSGPSTSTSPKSKTMKRKEELELQGVYSISENSFFSNRDNTRRISERATSAKGLLPKELVKKISKSQSLNRVESMKKDQLRGYPLCKPPTFRHDNLWEDYQQKKLEQDNLQENHVDRKLKKRFSSSGKSLTDSKRPVLNLSREFPLNNKQQSKVSSRKSPLRKSSPLPPLVKNI